MPKYDAIITLGNGINRNWKAPVNVVKRLKYIADLYHQGYAPKIIISGKWSISWDANDITPPTTEAEEMKKVLIKYGIPAKDIIKEEDAKDTIGNVFYLKTKIFNKFKLKKALVITADYHLKRVKYLFNKIIRDEIKCSYKTVPSESAKSPIFMKMEDEILKAQKKFLKNMKDGDINFLKDRLYQDPYYKNSQKSSASAQVSMHGTN